MLRGTLFHLLCRSRHGSRDAALLHYTTHHHPQHGRYVPGALIPPSTPLLHFLAWSSSAPVVGDGGADPSASPSRRTAIPPSVVDYLIQSYGFSPDEASGVIKRLGRSKTAGNPESVLSFFKGKGLEDAMIRKAVLFRPSLLYVDVEKTLAPKFRAFEEMGFTRSDMLKILARNSSLLSNSVEKKLIPNISLLRAECGISGQRLLRFLKRSSRAVGRSTNSLKEIIERVRELGIPHGSAAFDMALHITDSLSRSMVDERLKYFRSLGWTEEETLSAVRRNPFVLGVSVRKVNEMLAYFKGLGWTERDALWVMRRNPFLFGLSGRTVDEKLAFFKSLGWTVEETSFAVRRNPFILTLSEAKLKDSVYFFVEEIGCCASFIAAHPVLLTFSIEKRVKPRYSVYQILQLKHLREGDWSLPYLFLLTERKFMDKVILKYMDRFPELNVAYGAGS